MAAPATTGSPSLDSSLQSTAASSSLDNLIASAGSGKKLVFYLVRLRYRAPILRQNDQSEVKQLMQSMIWYSITGAKIDGGKLHDAEWTKKLDFLNPANETLSQLWESGERSTSSEHERFALIGWPASADIMNAVALFGEVSCVPVILAQCYNAPNASQRRT
ncbi:hypothetical protein PRIC2_009038 [Phytophthora ramorum]